VATCRESFRGLGGWSQEEERPPRAAADTAMAAVGSGRLGSVGGACLRVSGKTAAQLSSAHQAPALWSSVREV
jgi:hypothetical protein